jgi:heterodisulfide reductase subunit B
VRYAFFPGCSLESTAWDFDRSTRAVCAALGIDLEDIPDWVCCGSTPAHASNASLAVALPVLNLQKAQAADLPVMTACASCYARLRTANHKVRNEPDERERCQRITGRPYGGEVEVRHVLDVLVNDFGLERIRDKVLRPLEGLRVACYYGCLLTRPPEIVAFDDPEHPTAMDDLAAAIGAEPVDWPLKTECCGASLSMTRTSVVSRLGHGLLSMARQAGAECVVVACPLCQVNLDLRQADAGKAHGAIPRTPVLYVTQLLGLALGLSFRDLGLDALTVGADALLARTPPRPLSEEGQTRGSPRPLAGEGQGVRAAAGAASQGNSGVVGAPGRQI